MSAASEARWKARCIREVEAKNQRAGEMEVLRRAHVVVRVPVVAEPVPSRRAVRRWCQRNAGDYETATELAEAAQEIVPAAWLDDPVHWIWDEALDAMEREP